MDDIALTGIIVCGIVTIGSIIIIATVHLFCKQTEDVLPQTIPLNEQGEPPPTQQQLQEDNEANALGEAGYGFPIDEYELGLRFGDTCQICQDGMNGQNTITRLTNCNHAFHKKCITTWFTKQYKSIHIYNCPICRDMCPNTMIETKLVTMLTRNIDRN